MGTAVCTRVSLAGTTHVSVAPIDTPKMPSRRRIHPRQLFEQCQRRREATAQ